MSVKLPDTPPEGPLHPSKPYWYARWFDENLVMHKWKWVVDRWDYRGGYKPDERKYFV